jgi:hypothetical protein
MMKTMQWHMRVWICLFFLTAACLLDAQEFTGRVTDPTGAFVPKVTVIAHDVDTGVDTKATTNSTGTYTIPYLHHGSYTVSATKAGFKEAIRAGINLQIDETSVVNFALQVGSATETVTVTADTVLDYGKADVGEVVENARVTELPLNGRDPLMLSELAAGVNYNYNGYTRPFDDTQQYTSVNGGGAGNVEMLLDGTPNNVSPINITDADNGKEAHTAYTTPVDSVQEFKMVTSPYDSQYGMMAGGVEDVILKSGTNTIHGDIYEFARRTFLDANTWENDWAISQLKPGADKSNYKTPQSKWDQYGFELDGPIVVPKLYNGKDKSFFTIQWEHFHALSPLTDIASIPDPLWADGDFSTLDYWNGSEYAPKYIYDPLTSVQDTNASSSTAGDWVRTQFHNNQIPTSRLSPMAQKIMKMYPTPNVNVTSGRDHTSSNYVYSTSGIDVYNNILLKWDQHWTDKDRFTLRYGYWMWNNTYNGNGLPAPLTTGAEPIVRRSHTFALEEVHTFTPNLLLDFRANVMARADLSRSGVNYDPTNLGWSQSEVSSMGTAAKTAFPQLCWQDSQWGCYYSGYTIVGSSSNSEIIKDSLNLLPMATWIKGTHTIRAGIDIRLWQNGYTVMNGGATINTGGNWTSYTANHADNAIVNDGTTFASFVLGVPWDARNQIWPQTYQSQHYYAPFVQDDWKVTRKLTLNLGLRWDWMPAETERRHIGNYAFDTTTVNPYLSSVNLAAYGHGALTGGVTFLDNNGNPNSDYRTRNFNYQPRVGFAYALNDKTVLRGGFGKSMRAAQNGNPVDGYSASTVGTTSNPNYASGVMPNVENRLDSLFWGGPTGNVLQPTGSSLGLGTDLGQGLTYNNPHYKNPSFWSYSLGFQRQLARNSSVNVSYVGSRLYDGDSTGNINLQNNSLRAACSILNGGDPHNCDGTNGVYATSIVANPFQGMSAFSGSSYQTNTTMSILDLSRPMPQFQDVTEDIQNDARTWYNSLQITVLSKISDSLTIHGTETWSKLMDAGTWDDQLYGIRYRTIDSNDMPHRITISGVYKLPIGRGHMVWSNANRIIDEVIGGWELSGLFIWQSGIPQSVPGYYLHQAKVNRHTQKNDGYIRVFSPFAEHYVQGSSKGQYNVQQYEGTTTTYDYDGTNPGYANFMDVPSYAPATMVEYTGIREAGLRKFDTSFSKNFALYENLKLQFRVDAFNVLNHPEWTGSADTGSSDANLGAINKGPTGSSVDPRLMQLSAKIVW